MRKLHTAVGLGEILWDIYPDSRYLGGATTNAAIHAYRLGAHGVVASAAGLDEAGDEIVAELKSIGMETSWIQRISTHSTGTVYVELNEKREPEFTCSKDVAFDHIEWCPALESLALKSDCVFFGTLAQRNKDSRQAVQKFLSSAEHAVRIFDVNLREWNEDISNIVEKTLKCTDILKFNEKEMSMMKRSFGKSRMGFLLFLDWLMDAYNLKVIALSLGERGCIITNGKERVFSPGICIHTVDTTGCGDAFIAALAWKFLEGAELEEIAEFANVLGAFTGTRKGAAPEYTMNEINRFMESHRDRVEHI